MSTGYATHMAGAIDPQWDDRNEKRADKAFCEARADLGELAELIAEGLSKPLRPICADEVIWAVVDAREARDKAA